MQSNITSEKNKLKPLFEQKKEEFVSKAKLSYAWDFYDNVLTKHYDEIVALHAIECADVHWDIHGLIFPPFVPRPPARYKNV